jgi:hypothetical protein
MISLSPSLRMIAPSPGDSNSHGIRTAWFRPFLKSSTCRSEAMVTLTAYVQAYAENGLSVYGVDVRSCHSGYSQDFPAPSF